MQRLASLNLMSHHLSQRPWAHSLAL